MGKKNSIEINRIAHSLGRSNKLESTEAKTKDMAEQLKRNISVNGIISAITLVPVNPASELAKTADYLCVDGNQRLWCFEALGNTELPENMYNVKTDIESSDTQGIEASANYFRIPETKAEYMARVKLAIAAGETVQTIARKWGVDQRTIESWAAVDKLPEEIKDRVVSGEIGLTAAAVVMKKGNLSPEEKIAIVSNFTRDTTAETAATVAKEAIDNKRKSGLIAKIQNPEGGSASTVSVEKAKPIFSVAKAEEIFAMCETLCSAGRDDSEFLLVNSVMGYIFGLVKSNPLNG